MAWIDDGGLTLKPKLAHLSHGNSCFLPQPSAQRFGGRKSNFLSATRAECISALAFAVLTKVDPEILIIDEALAVSDFLFQKKCYGEIREFRRSGCTFLFVSHGMGAVLELCDRAMVLDRGRMIFAGDPKAAVDLYEARSMRSRFGIVSLAPVTPPATGPAATAAPGLPTPGREAAITSESVNLENVRILDSKGEEKQFVASGGSIRIAISVRFNRPVRDPHIGFKLRRHLGVVFYETNTYCMRQSPGTAGPGDVVTAEFSLRLPLIEGEYSVTAAVANEGRERGSFAEALHYQHEARHFVVTRGWSLHEWHGLFNFEPTVSISRQPQS